MLSRDTCDVAALWSTQATQFFGGFHTLQCQLSHPRSFLSFNLLPFLWSPTPYPDFPLCRAFTVTAIAQMCILGLMWVFGSFLFEKDNIVGAYIFTILNSLQGALVFIMHCLLSKQVGHNNSLCLCFYTDNRESEKLEKIKWSHRQNKLWDQIHEITVTRFQQLILFLVFCCPLQVREEYARFLSCICKPEKRYSDLTSTNPSSSSQSQVSMDIFTPLHFVAWEI